MSIGAYPLPRERYLILALLLALAAGAWGLLFLQATATQPMATGPTMGLAAPVFLAVWVAMMVAMMFPAAAPMILTFSRVHAARRERGQAFVPTWIFVGAYLLAWTAFGAVAYAAAELAEALVAQSEWLSDNASRIGGVVIGLAGVYQLSPLKRVCLAKCRTPLQFILSSWRSGYRGALRMGLAHGAYCLGCCWMLFVLLFPLGVMNVAAMALLTVLIFGEKALPGGPRIGQVAAVTLIGYGLLVVAVPDALPRVGGAGMGM